MNGSSMKVDIFCHIIPPKFKEALYKIANPGSFPRVSIDGVPTLFDLDFRFRLMDKYEGYTQVLTLAAPPIEDVTDSEKAVDLARLANDEMAELVFKYPDRFAAAVACLPMNNIDAALVEVDRAINDLKMRGILIYTPTNDKPLDSPEFIPLYEKMSCYNLPIWIHPTRPVSYADYKTENKSLYRMHLIYGWPYETTVAMTRLVFMGIFDRYPDLKFITHHCGAMVPFFERRIASLYDLNEMRHDGRDKRLVSKAPVEYFKMFYNDTAICGSTPALMCGHAFFGSEHILFGTDLPYDSQVGDRNIRDTIDSIEQMPIPQSDKKKIFEDNARKLLRLPI